MAPGTPVGIAPGIGGTPAVDGDGADPAGVVGVVGGVCGVVFSGNSH